jgi:hypothetical protein
MPINLEFIIMSYECGVKINNHYVRRVVEEEHGERSSLLCIFNIIG